MKTEQKISRKCMIKFSSAYFAKPTNPAVISE
jgi:hypothetical protein